MQIKKATEMKASLEKEVADKLAKFTQKTGLRIRSITISSTVKFGGTFGGYSLYIEASLPRQNNKGGTPGGRFERND